MKHKILICTLAAALTAGGLTVTAFAAEKTSSNTTLREGVLKRIVGKLDLTADQQTQIKSVLKGEKDNLKPLASALHEARENLRTAIRASDANESSVRAASAKVASAEADLSVERMKIYAKIAPILTDAQKHQLSDIQQQFDNLADNVIANIGAGLDN